MKKKCYTKKYFSIFWRFIKKYGFCYETIKLLHCNICLRLWGKKILFWYFLSKGLPLVYGYFYKYIKK